MIKALLEKRSVDYSITTKDIMDVYRNNFIRALRFFTKSDQDIQIISVYPHPLNSNFIVNTCVVKVEVGDVLKLNDGEDVSITESNINSIKLNEIVIISSIAQLENGSAVSIYEEIKEMQSFLDDHGVDKFNKVMESGIKEFRDILDKPYEPLLEELTDPTDLILNDLDDLKKVQYNIFLNSPDRRIH